MVYLLLWTLIWGVCSGMQDASSYSSSFMYGEKPILRLGPDEPDEDIRENPPAPKVVRAASKEPEWVTMLRDNIKSVIGYKGFNFEGKQVIKELIEDANEKINPKVEAKKPEDGLSPLRSLINQEDNRQPEVRTRFETRWEKDLKQYIKGLMGVYGKKNLNGYVEPVVKAIEENNNIAINDIDVNPYGEITISWSPKKNNKINNSGMKHASGNQYATMMPDFQDDNT